EPAVAEGNPAVRRHPQPRPIGAAPALHLVDPGDDRLVDRAQIGGEMKAAGYAAHDRSIPAPPEGAAWLAALRSASMAMVAATTWRGGIEWMEPSCAAG